MILYSRNSLNMGHYSQPQHYNYFFSQFHIIKVRLPPNTSIFCQREREKKMTIPYLAIGTCNVTICSQYRIWSSILVGIQLLHYSCYQLEYIYSCSQVLDQFATEHKLNNLSCSISSSHCIVINMAPSTSIEMRKIVVCWCFEQHKTAFEISVLFLAVQSEPWLRFCNLDYVGIMAKSILLLVSGAALTFLTMAILNIYMLWILHYNWMSCRSFAAQDKDVSLGYDDTKLRLFCSFSRQLYQQ